jgi:preprotein translocase subunit SecG
MFASIFVVFIITDLFLVVLPKHKKSKETNDDQSDSEYSNN